MSILADLLSKKNSHEARSSGEIPPTLARAQAVSQAKSGASRKRYQLVGLAALLLVVAGMLASLKIGNQRLAMPMARVTSGLAGAPSPVASKNCRQEAASLPPTPPAPGKPAEALNAPEAVIAAAPLEKMAKPVEAAGVDRPRKRRIAGRAHRIRKPAGGSVRPAQAGNRADAAKRAGSLAGTPKATDVAVRSTLLYTARSAELSGDWRLALANYRSALEIDPDNYRVMSNEAAAYNNLGMYEEGLREAKRALDWKPDYLPALINAAIASSSKGNDREAMRYLSVASAKDPSNRDLIINLGVLRERTGKLDEARASYLKLAQSGDFAALMGLARISERKGNKAEAIVYYRQILTLKELSQKNWTEVINRLAILGDQQ